MFERVLTLVVVLTVLVGGGIVVAKKFSGHKAVSAVDRRLIQRAVARKEPGAAFMSTKCDSGGCTVWLRKGATHVCDGWQGTVSPDGQVSLVAIGHKGC